MAHGHPGSRGSRGTRPARSVYRFERVTNGTVPVALIPGAGGQGWIWHLVEADLRRRGYDAFAVDLPAADEGKGLPAYADAVVGAIGDRDPGSPVVVAAYSLGGFTVPLVWQRVPVRQVVFVNAMIPRPGATPGAWWDNVGWEQARTAAARRDGYPADFDLDAYFLHDVPACPVSGGPVSGGPVLGGRRAAPGWVTVSPARRTARLRLRGR
jgi:alpha-beta hydrolase superfamily lysophospholipase